MRLGQAGRLKDLPPMLAFQSIVDATVSTTAVLRTLYDQLPANGSTLVLFDVNHRSGIDVFVRAEDLSHVARLFDREARPFRRVLITNSSSSTNDVISRTVDAGQLSIVDTPLGLSWPADVYSLTHIALPFTPDDVLYGNEAEPSATGLLRLGRLSPRGERSVLTVSTDTLMRLSSNPFFPYLADTLRAWVATPAWPLAGRRHVAQERVSGTQEHAGREAEEHEQQHDCHHHHAFARIEVGRQRRDRAPEKHPREGDQGRHGQERTRQDHGDRARRDSPSTACAAAGRRRRSPAVPGRPTPAPPNSAKAVASFGKRRPDRPAPES